MEGESASCLGGSRCVFHRGHEFITVHLQLFAVAAGLLPVQLRRTQSDSKPAERREGQTHKKRRWEIGTGGPMFSETPRLTEHK